MIRQPHQHCHLPFLHPIHRQKVETRPALLQLNRGCPRSSEKHKAPIVLCLALDRKHTVQGSGDIRCSPDAYVSLDIVTDFTSDIYLQNGQLMHFLSRASRDHFFQHTKLFIHLRPPSPLNNAVSGLPRNLASSARGCGLFPLACSRCARPVLLGQRGR